MLSGCASGSWDPDSWFGNKKPNVDHNANYAHPGYGTGTLSPPDAAPVPPVQATVVVAPQSTGNAAAPMPAPGAAPAAAQPVKAKVAILLPLTGKNAALGQAMLNASQQAVFDSASNNFELMPRDTGEGEAAAATAARDAIGSGAQLLIGPLFGTSVPPVKSVAESANVDMLTLSTDTLLADKDVFVMGLTPGTQVERIVAYASAHGLHHYAALVPDTAYGTLVGQIFQRAVVRNRGVMVEMDTYNSAKHNSEAYAQQLAQHRNEIDALFLPIGGAELNLIVSQLAMKGIDSKKIRLLGTGLWDVSDVGQNPFMVSGWFAAPDPALRRNFIAAYKDTYGQEPPRLTTLAYDATALAATLAKRGAKFDTASLTNPNGFAGVDGIFRLTPQGFVERGLAINEITTDGARMIEPSPTTFAAGAN
jgi:ABC-type branched-subunit amino acid transport system substrate-binding protein